MWDVFAERKELGGAPANFAYMTSLLGDRRGGGQPSGARPARKFGGEEIGATGIIARVVADGSRNIRQGQCNVQIAGDGQPKFEIAEPEVAWDYLEWTAQWQELAGRAAAVCFGSLAQRAANSRKRFMYFCKHCRPEALKVLRCEFAAGILFGGDIAASQRRWRTF